MKKIIDVSELLQLSYQFTAYDRFGGSAEDLNVIDVFDIRTLLDKAPSVSGEAHYEVINAETKDVLGIYDNIKSAEWWQKSYQLKDNISTIIKPTQNNRVVELEATNKKLLDASKNVAEWCNYPLGYAISINAIRSINILKEIIKEIEEV